jgi:hypothetical protein
MYELLELLALTLIIDGEIMVIVNTNSSIVAIILMGLIFKFFTLITKIGKELIKLIVINK